MNIHDSNVLFIKWQTGHMTLLLDEFFPCNHSTLNKLLHKVIALDWENRDALKEKSISYLQERKADHVRKSLETCYFAQRGDIERNTESARQYCRIVLDTGKIPIAPHLYFTQFLDDNDPSERRIGMF